MEQKINLSINEGKGFFAHEASINYSPTQFILDFKCITPRVDPRSAETANIHMEHEVIMVEPYHALRVHELLGDMLKKYEKDFGKIEKPKSLEKAEKRAKQANKPEKSDLTYFG
ncbi:DUF3467 domain-containing protein [Candidatus Woesearchaeota archaeon]|nr:DUF3467 domain-containing protein [Candidatus Woesearchaeota archaeon]